MRIKLMPSDYSLTDYFLYVSPKEKRIYWGSRNDLGRITNDSTNYDLKEALEKDSSGNLKKTIGKCFSKYLLKSFTCDLISDEYFLEIFSKSDLGKWGCSIVKKYFENKGKSVEEIKDEFRQIQGADLCINGKYVEVKTDEIISVWDRIYFEILRPRRKNE